MSDALRRRRLTSDRTATVRRRLATLELDFPYSYGQEDDERPPPEPEQLAAVLGYLFDALKRDRERFAAFARGRAPEISDDKLAALTDVAARCAEENDARPRLELIRGGRDNGIATESVGKPSGDAEDAAATDAKASDWSGAPRKTMRRRPIREDARFRERMARRGL